MNNPFTDSRIRPELRQALKKIHFTKPTPVQVKVIPTLLARVNVIVQAATGSGKTHAYLVPVFNDLDENKNEVQAIITAPSRELAEQLYQVAQQLKKAAALPLAIAHLAGGTDRQRQIERMKRKKPQLVIATPGRLLDFVSKKVFPLDQVKDFIIDEADMTMDMGFLSAIEQVTSRLPKDVLFGAFSATIPVKLANFLKKHLLHPDEIVLANPAIIPPTIKNDLLDIGSHERKEILYELLTMGQPYLALVFANTKEKVDELASYLKERGLKVAKIHGGLAERERKRTLRQVEEGHFQYVVATDLAARGLDIQGVSLVINYEVPRDLEFMIHRIGRTGRKGLPGHAITLIRTEEMGAIEELEKTGLRFDLVALKNGFLVPRKHYRRQKKRHTDRQPDTKLVGYIKKEKRKRKPGYKKKIRQAVRKDQQEHYKLEQLHRIRKAKRRRKRLRAKERWQIKDK